MIAYASRTGTRRNLDALRAAGWRLLVSAAGEHRHEGFPFAVDNGAWSAFKQGTAFDDAAFERVLASHGATADWIVVPDVVADSHASLDLTARWLPILTSRFEPTGPRLLVAVQDGMVPDDVRPWLRGRVGIFLGGSTEWKLETMRMWGELADELGVYYHVGRVNTVRRIRAAHEAGADSFDGTSVSQYVVNLPRLDRARREGSLSRAAYIDPPRDHVADADLVARELPTYRDDELVSMEAGALRILLSRARAS